MRSVCFVLLSCCCYCDFFQPIHFTFLVTCEGVTHALFIVFVFFLLGELQDKTQHQTSV